MSHPPEPFPEPFRLRASHADRERVAGVLNTAMAEGRITVPELEERLEVVYRAQLVGELEPVTRDLPGHNQLWSGGTGLAPRPDGAAAGPVGSGEPAGGRIGGRPEGTVAIAVMGGAERSGEWVVPRQFTAVAVMGGVELDLTRARLAAAEVTITAVAIMGGIEITVPDDVEVKVTGVGVMGGFDRPPRRDRPDGPRPPVLRINGIALMGGVEVRRAANRSPWRSDQPGQLRCSSSETLARTKPAAPWTAG